MVELRPFSRTMAERMRAGCSSRNSNQEQALKHIPVVSRACFLGKITRLARRTVPRRGVFCSASLNCTASMGRTSVPNAVQTIKTLETILTLTSRDLERGRPLEIDVLVDSIAAMREFAQSPTPRIDVYGLLRLRATIQTAVRAQASTFWESCVRRGLSARRLARRRREGCCSLHQFL